jgi:hypothetical protein
MNSLKRIGNVLKGFYDRHPKIAGVAATAIASAGLVFGAGGIYAAVQTNQENVKPAGIEERIGKTSYWRGIGLAAMSIGLVTGGLTAMWYNETIDQGADGATNRRRKSSQPTPELDTID